MSLQVIQNIPCKFKTDILRTFSASAPKLDVILTKRVQCVLRAKPRGGRALESLVFFMLLGRFNFHH